ncbi:PBP1A family penicillin-binding protein [Paenibacillaceae bacterium]|nr:PBP1A family penicillin-binding protein [Paenibacillaceae bacterium]
MNERRPYRPTTPTANQTAKPKPKPKKKAKRKFSARRLMIWLFFTVAFGVVCGIIGYMLIILNGERILSENKGKMIMAESSIIYDINKNEISKLYDSENRELVDFAEIPELVRDAFVAVEDKRFREHSGLDFMAIGRALVKDIIARKAVEGASTITQQLAKNMFLNHDKTLLRKATEASISVALENNLTKDQILEMYLNRIFFGKRAHGVKAAAELYFGKDNLKDLEIWEIATLAGIPKGPNIFNPLSNPERSKERRAVVLQLMYEQELITAEQMEVAKAKEYDPDKAKIPTNTKYMAFVDYAIEEAMRVTEMTEEELRLGGFHIYTTLNPAAQDVMETEFNNAENFEESKTDQKVQGAMIIMDHRTGEVQAMVGGRDYEKKGWNRVVKTRSPGSAFKPITSYGPALETGEWFPSSILRDDKQCFNDYCPRDSNRNKYIGPVSMRQAIKESRNLPAVWLLDKVGVDKGLEFAKTLGFELTSEDRNLAIALGGLYEGVTPMQMATAYSVFANDGQSVDAHTILKVEANGKPPEYEYKAPKTKQLIKVDTARYMTEIMQGVVEQGGTGTRAKFDRPLAGKTGTTQHGIPGLNSSANRDVWFVGYTPEWTASVWMGYDNTNAENLLNQSSGQAASLFAKVMSAAIKDVPRSEFHKSTTKEPEPPVVEIQRPATVSGFTASYIPERGDVQMSWNAIEGTNVVYRVYRKAAGQDNFVRISDMVDAIASEDLTVAEGTTYQYYVTAYDSVNNLEGDPSGIATVEVTVDVLEPDIPGVPDEGTDPGDGVTPPPDNPDPEQGEGNPDIPDNNPGTGENPGTDEGSGNNPNTPDNNGIDNLPVNNSPSQGEGETGENGGNSDNAPNHQQMPGEPRSNTDHPGNAGRGDEQKGKPLMGGSVNAQNSE